MLDPDSLGADGGGGSTGEFICIAALVIVDSVVAVAVSPVAGRPALTPATGLSDIVAVGWADLVRGRSGLQSGVLSEA